MDRRERFSDDEEMLRMVSDSEQATMWTALPVYVVEYNPAQMTCDLQPTTQCRQQNPDGSFVYVSVPVLRDCPVIFPTGGGFTLTFPIAPGDEGLAIFSSRCIDAWWMNGGVQAPTEIRMHDLSDGFYLPGCRSTPRVLANLSTGTTQLRSDDGKTFIEVAGGGIVNITAPTEINLNSPVVNVAGIIAVQNENNIAEPCTINGQINATGDVIAGTNAANISLLNHVHTGVQRGTGSTDSPTG